MRLIKLMDVLNHYYYSHKLINNSSSKDKENHNRFYFSVYPVVLVTTENIYKTLETVFYRLFQHLEFRQTYSATRRILNSLLGVWIS